MATQGPKFKFTVPPQAEAALGVLLKEVGKAGAKALAAAVGSGVADVRKVVKKADRYLKDVEGRAEVVSRKDEQDDE
jgi:hypothetical protein